jgi:Polyketide cyclase / dehydrase and lipid transport
MWHDQAIARFEFHLEMPRPAHVVFAYLADPTLMHEWDPQIVEIAHEPPGRLTVGSRIHQTRAVLRRRVVLTLEVTELEEPVLLAMRIIEGPLPMEIRTVLEPQGATARAHVSATGELNGLARVAEPVVARAAKRQLRAYYERLRRRLARDEG